ncbi:MAG: hypothetical protein EHM40_23665 [Chloroflexi bacterium]|nr:MAG: hypothetical protein EHM40_23665 [Chloroflexota bacterium]
MEKTFRHSPRSNNALPGDAFMTSRNLDRAFDTEGQWTDAARDRHQGISGSPGEAHAVYRRKRRQVILAFSGDE